MNTIEVDYNEVLRELGVDIEDVSEVVDVSTLREDAANLIEEIENTVNNIVAIPAPQETIDLRAEYPNTENTINTTESAEESVEEVDDSMARFSSAVWFEEVQHNSIMVGGAGGISSHFIFNISRLHPSQLFVYDDDVVESLNLAGQFYTLKSIDKFKVNAVADIVQDFSNYRAIMAIPNKFTENTEGADIMICGFDNMEARKIFFNAWLKRVNISDNKSRHLFIDGRLTASEFQIFCITGDDDYNINRYSTEYLFDSSEAEETVCSLKQTTYCASIIGAMMCNLYTNFCANKVGAMFDLPFKTFYDANLMLLMTES